MINSTQVQLFYFKAKELIEALIAKNRPEEMLALFEKIISRQDLTAEEAKQEEVVFLTGIMKNPGTTVKEFLGWKGDELKTLEINLLQNQLIKILEDKLKVLKQVQAANSSVILQSENTKLMERISALQDVALRFKTRAETSEQEVELLRSENALIKSQLHESQMGYGEVEQLKREMELLKSQNDLLTSQLQNSMIQSKSASNPHGFYKPRVTTLSFPEGARIGKLVTQKIESVYKFIDSDGIFSSVGFKFKTKQDRSDFFELYKNVIKTLTPNAAKLLNEAVLFFRTDFAGDYCFVIHPEKEGIIDLAIKSLLERCDSHKGKMVFAFIEELFDLQNIQKHFCTDIRMDNGEYKSVPVSDEKSLPKEVIEKYTIDNVLHLIAKAKRYDNISAYQLVKKYLVETQPVVPAEPTVPAYSFK